MKEKFIKLLDIAMQYRASDVHFVVQEKQVQVSIRGEHGMQKLQRAIFDVELFNYVKYIANLDLGNSGKPQSGNFSFKYQNKVLFFRFSLIHSFAMQTAVLRILNNHEVFCLQDLLYQKKQLAQFLSWTRQTSGLVVLSGPTGSGKTTTLHALLDEIARLGNKKIITLEDPIEIIDERYVQLAINDAAGFTYEEGIRQLLRHDPDVIMLGEIRDTKTARMAYRCALTGHMVFSSVHAKNAQEAIKRLCELGLAKKELKDTLSAVCAQRLYFHRQKKGERICLYEILQGKELYTYLDGKAIPQHHSLTQEITRAMENGLIDIEDANEDLCLEEI